MVSQPPGNKLGKVRERALDLLQLPGVLIKGGFVTDRFGLLLVGVGAGILAACFRVEPLAVFPEAFFQTVAAPTLQVTDGPDAKRLKLRLRDLADPRHAPDGQWRQKLGLVTRHHPEKTVRLGLIGRDLRDQV